MILLDNTIVNVALPAIQSDLDVTPANLEWVVNAYVLALAALILVGGTLGDRYGRKRLYLVGFTVFTVFSAACALAQDDPELVVFRACQGVGAAIVAPLSLSIIVDAFPAERRSTAIGVWAAVAGLGFAAGPIVGGVLIEIFDWSAIFWVNVPIAVLGIALTLAFVRESRDPEARRLDPVGALLVASGLFLLTFAVIETNEHAWLSAYTLSLLGAAALLLAGFVAWERRTPHPMVPLALFAERRFTSANAVYAIAYAALAGMFFFVTLFFQNVKGWTALETGLSWIAMSLPFLVVSPLSGRAVRRFGAATTSGVGILLGGIGIIGLAELDGGSGYGAAWPFYVLVGLGYGIAVPAVVAAAADAMPPEQSGVGSGILNSSRQVGAAVGLAVLGSLSVAAVARAWAESVATFPADVRVRADALVQRVAGAETDSVARIVGSEAAEAAQDAFVSGLHFALWTAGVSMIVAAAIAYLGLRAPAARRDPAAR
jgi:EmrB/QacA subfamily drug resistance transporter